MVLVCLVKGEFAVALNIFSKLCKGLGGVKVCSGSYTRGRVHTHSILGQRVGELIPEAHHVSPAVFNTKPADKLSHILHGLRCFIVNASFFLSVAHVLPPFLSFIIHKYP